MSSPALVRLLQAVCMAPGATCISSAIRRACFRTGPAEANRPQDDVHQMVWHPQALVLLPLYAFCFAYWRWSREDMVDLRFTGREQQKDGQGSPVLPVSAPQQQPGAARDRA